MSAMTQPGSVHSGLEQQASGRGAWWAWLEGLHRGSAAGRVVSLVQAPCTEIRVLGVQFQPPNARSHCTIQKLVS